MLIYSVFVCLAATNSCSPASGYIGQMRTYNSLQECQGEARFFARNNSPDSHGKFFTRGPSGEISKQRWYECRSRHADSNQ
jgi:hypothetical protein